MPFKGSRRYTRNTFHQVETGRIRLSFQKAEGADRIDVNVSREEFCTSVARAKEYIRDGRYSRSVLSQRLETFADHDPLDVYRVLRVLNPSPYMYCLKLGLRDSRQASPRCW